MSVRWGGNRAREKQIRRLTGPGRQGDQGRPETALVSPFSSRDRFGLVGPELYVPPPMKRLCRTHYAALTADVIPW